MLDWIGLVAMLKNWSKLQEQEVSGVVVVGDGDRS